MKMFLKGTKKIMGSTSIRDLLELSQDPKHLIYAYKQIRQEVSFLANLSHPNLTKLCGVRTSPYMCLILELAPQKSLRYVLQAYNECGVILEPLMLKNTALQVLLTPPPPYSFRLISILCRLLKAWSTFTPIRWSI